MGCILSAVPGFVLPGVRISLSAEELTPGRDILLQEMPFEAREECCIAMARQSQGLAGLLWSASSSRSVAGFDVVGKLLPSGRFRVWGLEFGV